MHKVRGWCGRLFAGNSSFEPNKTDAGGEDGISRKAHAANFAALANDNLDASDTRERSRDVNSTAGNYKKINEPKDNCHSISMAESNSPKDSCEDETVHPEAMETSEQNEPATVVPVESDVGSDGDVRVAIEQQVRPTVHAMIDDTTRDSTHSDANVHQTPDSSRPIVREHKIVITDHIESNHIQNVTGQSNQTQSQQPQPNILAYNLNQGIKFYRLELKQSIWEVPTRYQDIKPVGAGSYGLVGSAYDTETQMRVAIKKLARPFQSPIHAKRTYRELTLLAHMKHENVIGLLDVFSPCKSFLEFNDVYLVTHLMGADLGGIIRTQRLSDEHIQFLTYQILRGLKYIHSAGIIHRDLKPSNIAVNEDCELKVLDFGLARHAEAEMTGYVATRWYRAPEIMLNWMRYNQTVDIWSVGCIMAELITSRTLFPGKDHIDQLLRIMTLCGTPDADFMAKITSEEARNYVRTLSVMKRKNFYEIFAGANPLAIDLLDQMLKLDSDLRPTAEQALAHPYLASCADPNDEPTASSLYDESFENEDRSVDNWKQLVWREIVNFKQRQ